MEMGVMFLRCPVSRDFRCIIFCGAKLKKTLAKVLAGSRNIAFNDFILLVEGFGFHLSRTSGGHHIFVHARVKELVERYNLQIEE
jgi:hypothetical protein